MSRLFHSETPRGDATGHWSTGIALTSLEVDEEMADRPVIWYEALIAGLLAVFSGILYFCTMSRVAFPGLPASLLARHCRLDPSLPTLLDPFWGIIIRKLTAWNPAAPAYFPNLFSVFCGALSVGLLSLLVMRVRSFMPNDSPIALIRHEHKGRVISGLVAGLYLTCSIAFWVAATRSLPATFHLLLAVLGVTLFTIYQYTRENRFLFALGLLSGIACVEFTTYYFLMLFFIALLAFAHFQDSEVPVLRPCLIFAGTWLVALMASYAFVLWLLMGKGTAELAGFSTWHALLLELLRQQASLITQIKFTIGLPILFALAGVPWLFLFPFSNRSPVHYAWGEATARLVFLSVLLMVLYNLPLSPWNFLGMQMFLVTPYVIMAICCGYLAQEFWMMGYSLQTDASWVTYIRKASMVFVCLIPLLIAGAAITNLPIATGRSGAVVDLAVSSVLNEMGNSRKILLSGGVLDDQLRLAGRTRNQDVLVITLPRTASPLYLQHLATRFDDPQGTTSLTAGHFDAFMHTFLLSPTGRELTAALDFEAFIRPYGFIEPTGFLSTIRENREDVDLTTILQKNRSFWEGIQPFAENPPHKNNPAFPYHQYLCRQAAKMANLLGLLLSQANRPEDACEAFRRALQTDPENISSILNLLMLTDLHPTLTNNEEKTGWDTTFRRLIMEVPPTTRYNLAATYGYIIAPRLREEKHLWMFTGTPENIEAAHRQSITPDEARTRARIRRLLTYAHFENPPLRQNKSTHLREIIQSDRNLNALHGMARLYIAEMNFPAASAFLEGAANRGSPDLEVDFDRALLAAAEDRTDEAIEELLRLNTLAYADLRIWVALAFLLPDTHPAHAGVIQHLRTHRGEDTALWLIVAGFDIAAKRYDTARRDIETALANDPRRTDGWELLVAIDDHLGDATGRILTLKTLLTIEPNHPFRFTLDGLQAMERGDYTAAEQAFRQTLINIRDATTLAALADTLLRTDGDPEEALTYLNEALTLMPDRPDILFTRATALHRMERLQEAITDLSSILDINPGHFSAMLLHARLLARTGKQRSAAQALPTLQAHRAKLTREENRHLSELQRTLEAAALRRKQDLPR